MSNLLVVLYIFTPLLYYISPKSFKLSVSLRREKEEEIMDFHATKQHIFQIIHLYKKKAPQVMVGNRYRSSDVCFSISESSNSQGNRVSYGSFPGHINLMHVEQLSTGTLPRSVLFYVH